MGIDRKRDRRRVVDPDEGTLPTDGEAPGNHQPEPISREFSLSTVAVLLFVGLAITGVLIWATLNDEEDSGGADIGVTVSDVVENTGEYLGVPVTVNGTINDVIADTAFTIGGKGFANGGALLIVGTEGTILLPEGMERDDEDAGRADAVEVTGVVAEFDIAEAEAQLGLDLDDELFEEYEGDAAIFATNVTTSPRPADLPPSALNVEQIREDTEAFLGEEITLNGEVAEVVGPHAFLLQDSADEEVIVVEADEALLVIAPQDLLQDVIDEDVPVVVTGEVRLLVAEDEAELEQVIELDIDAELFDRYEGTPVLLATAIDAGTEADVLEIERLAADATTYAGEEITTGGAVEEVISDRAIILTTDEEDEAVVEVRILVAGSEHLFTDAIVEDAFVQVTGTVRIIDTDLEEEFSGDEEVAFLFEDAAFEFEDGTVLIVADSIDVIR